jgi:hypothetical protein
MNIRTLSVVALVVAAVSSPAFAQDSTVEGQAVHKHTSTRHFHNTYNQAPLSEPGYNGASSASEGRSAHNSFDPSDLVAPNIVPGN